MSASHNKIHTEFAGLVEALRAGGFPFLLVGGLSLLAHHVERATGDIDFACDKTNQDAVARRMAELAVRMGIDLFQGKKPAETLIEMPVTLMTADKVKDYAGWGR